MVRQPLLLSGVILISGWLSQATVAQDVAAQSTSQPAPSETVSPSNEAVSPPSASPSTNGPRPGPLSLDELSLDLGFEGSYDKRTVRQDSPLLFGPNTRQTDRARTFEETLGLHALGNAWGPDALQFDVNAEYGLSQNWFSESGFGPELKKSPHGDILEYDLSLTAFPRGKVTTNAFAQKLDSRMPRMFLPSLDRTLERSGADVLFNDAKFPMRLSFEHVDDELHGRTWDLQDDEKRGTDTFRYEGTWQPSRNQSLRLEYEYTDRQERYSGNNAEFDTTRNYLSLDHILRFGKDDRSSLETLVRWQDEKGDLGRDYTEFFPRLRLQHTDKLATNYGFQYLRDSFQRLGTETYRGEAGISYQFDPAWTGSFQAYGLQQHADGNADFNEWGTIANVNYSKENSLGRLSGNLSYNHAGVETQSGHNRGVVIGESVTLTDPLPSFLLHTDIDPFTLVITDAESRRIYLPGLDYVAARVGRYTAVTRVPFGAIADRQTVLASYTYDVRDDYRINRDRVDLRVQQDFKCGLSPYYAGSIQDEDVNRDKFLPFEERDVNRHRVGSTYRKQRWSIGLEYEYNHDSIDPFQAIHSNGDIVLFQNAQHQLDGKVTASRFWFSGTHELESHDTTLVDAGSTYRYLLARNLEANASAMYRYEDDTLYGLTHGVDLSAAVDYRVGYFTLRFEAEYDLLSLSGSKEDGYSFWVKLKREIPVIHKETQ